jgi:4-amino-4-deoxy-L-arabinose transferase-like glycosyltransferase
LEIAHNAKRQWWWLVVAALLLGGLYFANLTRMGLVGPDEPRYAAVGRAMALSGDWVTPRLWGQPWFEKPALLYWMTAAGFKAGLDADLAPRLPVALLSVAFLTFFWWRVKIEWCERTAWFATAILATSAGWLTYSEIAVTDVPLAVFFSAAVLLSLGWVTRGETRWLAVAAGCLALGTLAKGLVPLALFVPVLALRWRRIADWFRWKPLIAFAAIALPWYTLCTLRNGKEFIQVFFVQHHFERFAANNLQHVQPWWFYLPILLVLLFPWFPLLATIRVNQDQKLHALLVVAGFGVIFFSAAVNKLPGYLLPLLPAISILMGAGLERARTALVASIGLVALLPVAVELGPGVLAHGLRLSEFPWTWSAACLAGGILLGLLLWQLTRSAVRLAPVVFVLAGIGFIGFEFTAFPHFDQAASARPLWLENHPLCVREGLSRNTVYGLYYYSDRALPVSPLCPVLDPARPHVVR